MKDLFQHIRESMDEYFMPDDRRIDYQEKRKERKDGEWTSVSKKRGNPTVINNLKGAF